MKRTDFGVLVGFFVWAAVKAREREGSLGEVRVGEVGDVVEVVEVVVGVNCDVSSASWVRRRGSCEVIALERDVSSNYLIVQQDFSVLVWCVLDLRLKRFDAGAQLVQGA